MNTRSLQIEMVSLEDLVPKGHNYRKFAKLFDFRKVDRHLKSLESGVGRSGYGISRLFRSLLYQFMEDLSELEEALVSNVIAKWFCGFGLSEKSPDHSLFGQVRSRIGARFLHL